MLFQDVSGLYMDIQCSFAYIPPWANVYHRVLWFLTNVKSDKTQLSKSIWQMWFDKSYLPLHHNRITFGAICGFHFGFSLFHVPNSTLSTMWTTRSNCCLHKFKGLSKQSLFWFAKSCVHRKTRETGAVILCVDGNDWWIKPKIFMTTLLIG